MIFVREKLPFVDTLLLEHFRGFRVFRGSTPTARSAWRSMSQGSWPVWCVGEAGASNAVRYTAEPCNEKNYDSKPGHLSSVSVKESSGAYFTNGFERGFGQPPSSEYCFPPDRIGAFESYSKVASKIPIFAPHEWWVCRWFRFARLRPKLNRH